MLKDQEDVGESEPPLRSPPPQPPQSPRRPPLDGPSPQPGRVPGVGAQDSHGLPPWIRARDRDRAREEREDRRGREAAVSARRRHARLAGLGVDRGGGGADVADSGADAAEGPSSGLSSSCPPKLPPHLAVLDLLRAVEAAEGGVGGDRADVGLDAAAAAAAERALDRAGRLVPPYALDVLVEVARGDPDRAADALMWALRQSQRVVIGDGGGGGWGRRGGLDPHALRRSLVDACLGALVAWPDRCGWRARSLMADAAGWTRMRPGAAETAALLGWGGGVRGDDGLGKGEGGGDAPGPPHRLWRVPGPPPTPPQLTRLLGGLAHASRGRPFSAADAAADDDAPWHHRRPPPVSALSAAVLAPLFPLINDAARGGASLQDLCRLLWSLGALGLRVEGAPVASASATSAGGFESVAELNGPAANLDGPADGLPNSRAMAPVHLVRALLSSIASRLDDAGPDDLGQTARALGALSYRPPAAEGGDRLLRRLETAALYRQAREGERHGERETERD